MSASISCSERAASLLDRVRHGEIPDRVEVRALGEECTGDFFRVVVESLADSFDPAEACIYEDLMRVWAPARDRRRPRIPDRVDAVYVLSRVTLGADIKIVSPILTAMRARFPEARLAFVSNRKSGELFEADPTLNIDFVEANYPRGGSMNERLRFADNLRTRLAMPNRVVIDPDSRMTQLGLIPVCEPEHYFHFPSRTVGGESGANLSELVSDWLTGNFGVNGPAWIHPRPVQLNATRPIAAVSLGVGENEGKRLGLEFEAHLLAALAGRFRTVFVDRGVGGAEAASVTEAAARSGALERIRFWEGSFAGFASIIAQSDFYAGYDSAGQHAAAAAGKPLVTIFKGAPSPRFRQRWAPKSPSTCVIDADALSREQVSSALNTVLSGHL